MTRTGAEYREALRDGRKVYVLGEGHVDDVTTHPATSGMVEEYVAWYDRHLDPAWQDILFAPATAERERTAWAYVLPKSSADLVGMGRSFAKTIFLSAGNITHTPAYGNLIATGILTAVQEHGGSPAQVAAAAAHRASLATTQRYLTFCGGAAPIGFRLRPDPTQRLPLRIVRDNDAGIVVSGRLGMHTSPAYAEDIYIGPVSGLKIGEDHATFVLPVGAPGVTTICRKIAARHADRFAAPLSHRVDELEGMMWLDEVFVPWERVFLVGPSAEPTVLWLLWHHLYGWLAKAEFTLGLALALSDAIGLKQHEQTVDYILDIVVAVQTVRSCLAAAELDPAFTAGGNCHPAYPHLMPGGLALLEAHQRVSELLRIVPGSSLVVAPTDRDLADPVMAVGLDESFGGGGYTARQRAALLQLAADHVSSALDGRESSFELHASGGVPVWRGRLRQVFPSYNELANAVLRAIDLPMPEIDVSCIPAAPLAPRRPNLATTAPAGPPAAPKTGA
jgi:aromatic ring hydroxylase